jgi:hypothetical protein
MVHPLSHAANPSADAAAVLRRLGFALLFFAIPVSALFTRRAVVVLAPLAVTLLILASITDGGARNARDKILRIAGSAGGIAGLILLLWTALSLVWTPFLPEASERLLNIAGMVLMGVAGYLAIPERMRSANLYLLPIGVAAAALLGMVLAFRSSSGFRLDQSSFERGMIVLVLMIWPAITWLHSRGRNLEALAVVVVVALGALFTTNGLPLGGLVAGGLAFALTAISPAFGSRLTAVVMATSLLVAPLLPLVMEPVAVALLGPKSQAALALDIWGRVVVEEPFRLLTGHGLETSYRGRSFGLLPSGAPYTILFQIWYELGLVGAVAGAVLLYRAVTGARGHRPILGPGIMATFATGFALSCLGIGMALIWWVTALVVVMLAFIAIEHGQYNTTRPKATILRRRA